MNWPNAWWVVLPALGIGWSFVTVGSFAWRRRPDNRLGALMIAVGFGQFASGLWMVPVSLLYTIGLIIAVWFIAPLMHLLLMFPSGRLSGRAEFALVVAGYVIVAPSNAIPMLAVDTSDGGPPGVRNLLFVHANPRLIGGINTFFEVLLIGLLVVTGVVLVRRWRLGTSVEHRALSPVLIAGAAYATLTGLRLTFPGIFGLPGLLLAMMAIPYAFLAGLIRIQFFQMRALGSVMTALGDGSHAGDLPALLTAAFEDTRVQVMYWLDEQGRYVDQTGRPTNLPTEDNGMAVVPVGRDGHRLGAIILDATVASERSQLIIGLTAALELAMDNQRLQAELRGRISEFKRSRADLVRTSEAQRKQLERNLHDGAQQMLVSVRLRLGLIRESLSTSNAASSVTLKDVDAAIRDLDTALTELRELAHGLHPALLATRGLTAAIQSLADRTPIPVHVELHLRRLPEDVESTAYFVIAEGLTNVVKHAAATHVTVRAVQEGDQLLIDIHDDGIGGADLSGPGLRNLAARVAALSGHLRVETPAQDGTKLRIEIPVLPESPAERTQE